MNERTNEKMDVQKSERTGSSVGRATDLREGVRGLKHRLEQCTGL